MADKKNVVTAKIGSLGERKIHLNMWGLVLAEEHGFDIADLDLDEDGAKERKGNLRQMLEMLWIGMLPYDEDISIEEIGRSIGFADMPDVSAAFEKVVSRQLTDDVREQVKEAKKKAEASPQD